MTNTALNFDGDETRMTIAANVAAELKRQRWTGRSAAAALGLSQPYVARRLSGDTDLSGSDLALFAAFLKVPVSVFFDANRGHSDYMGQVLPFERPARRELVDSLNSRPAIVSFFSDFAGLETSSSAS